MTDRGGTTFKTNVPLVLSTFDKMGKKKAATVAIIARNVIVESFSGPRTGIWYSKRYTKMATYRASAPGERPAKPTGVLAGAVQFAVRTDRTAFSAWIGIPARSRGGVKLGYGIALELKPGAGRRPWLVPGMKDAKPAILRELKERWF